MRAAEAVVACIVIVIRSITDHAAVNHIDDAILTAVRLQEPMPRRGDDLLHRTCRRIGPDDLKPFGGDIAEDLGDRDDRLYITVN